MITTSSQTAQQTQALGLCEGLDGTHVLEQRTFFVFERLRLPGPERSNQPLRLLTRASPHQPASQVPEELAEAAEVVSVSPVLEVDQPYFVQRFHLRVVVRRAVAS